MYIILFQSIVVNKTKQNLSITYRQVELKAQFSYLRHYLFFEIGKFKTVSRDKISVKT